LVGAENDVVTESLWPEDMRGDIFGAAPASVVVAAAVTLPIRIRRNVTRVSCNVKNTDTNVSFC